MIFEFKCPDCNIYFEGVSPVCPNCGKKGYKVFRNIGIAVKLKEYIELDKKLEKEGKFRYTKDEFKKFCDNVDDQASKSLPSIKGVDNIFSPNYQDTFGIKTQYANAFSAPPTVIDPVVLE